jgi:hypothetical protein
MCDTNKNVTKMGVIIKGVYYIITKAFTIYLILKFDFWDLRSQGYLFHFPKVNWMVECFLFYFYFVMLLKW